MIELLVNTAVYDTYIRAGIIKKKTQLPKHILHVYIRMRTICRPRANTRQSSAPGETVMEIGTNATRFLATTPRWIAVAISDARISVLFFSSIIIELFAVRFRDAAGFRLDLLIVLISIHDVFCSGPFPRNSFMRNFFFFRLSVTTIIR